MNLSIRHSLFLYGILVTVLLLAGSLITWNSNVSLQRTEKEGQRIEHAMLAFKDVRYHVVQIQQFLTDAAAVGEADYTEAAREKTEALATLDSLAGLLPEERERVTGLKAAVETLFATGQRMADTYIREGREAGNAIMKAPGDGFDAAAEALSTQLQTMAADLHQREEDAEAAQTRTLNWMSLSTTAIAVVTLLLVLAANFVLYRVLMRMLGGEPAYAGQMAGHIAAGDLTQDIRLRTGDRESLLARISAMRDGLKDTVNAIRTGAEAVLEGTRQLDREAGQVVEGSRQQTDAASSVSSSVEELTVSIGQVADNAGSMNERALEAGRAAVQGGQEVRAATGEIRRVAESMQETARIIQSLGDESARITAIVDTIRGIAEQTNLLALNAAIEAARAGEQGRGFAVVADEVRKLAERTTLSTEEISAMVESIRHQALQSVQRMEENLAMAQQGVAQADKAYAAMDDVSRNADNTRADVEEMNATLQEQRSASASMARQVERIAQMVERNGAAVTRMAGELNKLERLSLDLESMVKRFRI